jgi:putative hydroxymethylpyrimidine transport system substrate-binding protein
MQTEMNEGTPLMNRRQFFLASTGAALGVVAPSRAPLAAADKFTLLLDWYVNPDHAPLVVAKEAGYFARLGLDVDMIVASDASAPSRLVAAGKADAAITYQPDLMLDIKAGLPLVRFGTLIETPLNCLIALQDGPVKSLADLKGRTVGYSIAGFEDAYLSTMLQANGVSVADIKTVNLNYNLIPPLLAGQVDAILDGYRNVEFIQLGLQGHPAIAYYPEENGVPVYDELVYVTRSNLRTDPRLARFVQAVEAATIFLTNHPDQALAIFLKAHPDLDDAINRAQFTATLSRFAKRPGAVDHGRYQRFAEFLKGKGLIDAIPAVDTYAEEPG